MRVAIDWENAPRLRQEWFQQDPLTVARQLLGKYLVQIEDDALLVAQIVETEAYLGKDDPASHSYRGKTERNAAMFGAGGTWYIYQIYGIHLCANVVTEQEGIGSAVLIRAARPVEGVGKMQQRRVTNDIVRLLKGPANFAKAFGFSLKENFQSVDTPSRFFVDLGEQYPISVSPRIGITKGKNFPYRFFIAHSPYRSR